MTKEDDIENEKEIEYCSNMEDWELLNHCVEHNKDCWCTFCRELVARDLEKGE